MSTLKLPLIVRITLLLFALLCVWDFTQRVWISTEVSSRQGASFDAASYTATDTEMTTAVSEWLAAREAQRQAATDSDAQQGGEPAVPLIEGGMNLGNMRVRVRAIYTASENASKFVLFDIQNIEQRSVEIIEAQEGYTVDSYTLETIDVDAVVFRSATGETMTIPVFDY